MRTIKTVIMMLVTTIAKLTTNNNKNKNKEKTSLTIKRLH